MNQENQLYSLLRRAGALAFLLTTACTVENGTGTLQGTLDVPACSFDSDGKPHPLNNDGINPAPFSATWKFFVGEPYDSSVARLPANQLNIRMQASSLRWEFADAITFWVLDSYEVARCVRHGMNPDGTGDWDPRYCNREPSALGPSGEGQVLVGTESEIVRSHFLLPKSCQNGSLYSDALGACSGDTCPMALCPGHGSWIRFSRFGSAEPSSNLSTSRKFKVLNGETIAASAFHVELCDDSTVFAQHERLLPVPAPAIRGVLDGKFSFVLGP